MQKIVIFITTLLWAVTTNAGNVSEFMLYSRNDIDREILSAEVVSQYQFLSGTVRVSWLRNEADNLASQLKQALIKAGVAASDIIMDKQYPGGKREAGALIVVSLERARFPYTCDYHRQYYAFDADEAVGCASENNLFMSLRDRQKVVF
ncbi:hypothetical protein [Erwinia sp. 9145]|uniref:hypothetical protein n=1 Tax=Erwinia sp. 9145 TaxID=1500895 RepID=UPI00055315C7|nr:hypothetical protein [Erwinia sp. 9145]